MNELQRSALKKANIEASTVPHRRTSARPRAIQRHSRADLNLLALAISKLRAGEAGDAASQWSLTRGAIRPSFAESAQQIQVR